MICKNSFVYVVCYMIDNRITEIDFNFDHKYFIPSSSSFVEMDDFQFVTILNFDDVDNGMCLTQKKEKPQHQ
ncbi:hypothetical protein DERP_006150 [Dermatophagoides pteronyssinus]|uniref:Uncharacterized protein n=1 Tax=Dermatophagoides pteronyssinus TaxID=6956 RepID=A0ABQ8JSG7_DERPT|nr:hypothetical protein DERP_006150 [Dermatophagoides pteronyssinus]